MIVLDISSAPAATGSNESTPSLPTADMRVDDQGDFISPAQYFVVLKCTVALRTIVCVGGIFGNCINIRTFLRMGLEDSVTIAFFTMAVSDLLLLIIYLANTMARLCQILERDLHVHFELNPYFVEVYCSALGRIFADMTMLLTTFLAIQRCLCVVKPFHFRGMFTRFRTFFIMILIWIYCVVCGALHASSYGILKMTSPFTNTSAFQMFRKPMWDGVVTYLRTVNAVILNLACQILVFVCVYIMAHALKKSVQFRKSTSNAVQETRIDDSAPSGDDKKQADDTGTAKEIGSSKETQAVVQVVIVSTIFLISSIPTMVTSITELIIPELAPMGEYGWTFAMSFDVRILIEVVNSAVNVFVYYKYNTKFRQHCFRANGGNKKTNIIPSLSKP